MTDNKKVKSNRGNRVNKIIDLVYNTMSNYHTQAQKDEVAQIAKENRQAVKELWKKRYGTELEMKFYEGDD